MRSKFAVLLLSGVLMVSLFTLFVLFNSSEREEAEQSEPKYDKPELFFLYHQGIRTPDDASSPQYKQGQILEELFYARAYSTIKKQNSRTQSNGVIAWTERGPANVPGRTRALLVLPSDPNKNTWLAGAATGGIWKTANAGGNWTWKSADFPAMPISSFAMAESNQNIVYAGTGEYISSIYRAIGAGIFKSTDQGDTWTQLPSTKNDMFSIVTRIIVDPSNPDVILASTVTSLLGTGTNKSYIMRSANGGNTWTKVYEVTLEGGDKNAIEQILFTPNNFSVQYASLKRHGVIKSIDGGLTWFNANTGMSPEGRVELAISPTNPDHLFASAVGQLSGTGSDLYVTSNGGQSWNLVDVRFNGNAVDFLGGQGFYDNTIAIDPFNPSIAYFGGVNYFRTTLGTGLVVVPNYRIEENNTNSFMFLISFANIQYDNQRLTVGPQAGQRNVEVRFGPGINQKAHRFTIPTGATSGVPASSYTYANYIDVPFQVWDVTDPTNPTQLMASFRDQNNNNQFDLVPQYFDTDPLLHSREYVYINNIPYSTEASPELSVNGGHEVNLMYNFFPCLAQNATWQPTNLPVSKLEIKYTGIEKLNATTITVADAYNRFDGKNAFNQVTLNQGVHPDHHYTVIVPMNQSQNTYKIILGNDGGVFVSNTSTTPGINNGDWTFSGNTYNTTQFYGADKRPGTDQYIGGSQDNGTRISPFNQAASSTTNYNYAIGGDGFEVLWHPLDGQKIIGSIYNNWFLRSLDGGNSWQNAFSGFPLVGGVPDPSRYPFVSKLAHSKNFPDRIFAVGSDGVWRSENFGENWTLTPITSEWGGGTFLDVEVSIANASIVWAGNAMSSTRKLHVSTNGGQSFESVPNYTNVTLGNITRLASHPFEEQTAYALFSFSGRPKILRTTNLGQSWEDISGFEGGGVSSNGFPDVAVYCLYVRPDNPDIIWAGTEIGIVESLDNGASWALLTDFPAVSVWDMKGQDDQVVIATHGRGIWTATIEAPQITVAVPEIIASGTTPKEKLIIKVLVQEDFDRIEIYEGIQLLGTINNVTPSQITIEIGNLTPGVKNIKTISYRGNAPFHSKTYALELLDLLSIEDSYGTYFSSNNDLRTNGFVIQPMPGTTPGERNVLRTNTPYSNNFNYTTLIRHPIRVAAENATLIYEDIAIVEPGMNGSTVGSTDFKDYVIVEGTKNGLDWLPLVNGYDARFNNQWLTAFNGGSPGSKSMFIKQEINMRNTFQAGDTLLIRYRMFTNSSVTGWGWAINYILIQQAPTGLESPLSETNTLAIYPNPANDKVTINFTLDRPSEISLEIIDITGRSVMSKRLGAKDSGKHSVNLNVADLKQSNYILQLKTREGNKQGRLIINR